jgi:O-antigen/teichoic acid export membrane protein
LTLRRFTLRRSTSKNHPVSALTLLQGARITCEVKLWRSGIIWSILSFIAGLGNLAVSAVLGHRLSKPEYGSANSTLDFVTFLGLPLQAFSTALIHYIAHFRGTNDQARLQGLLAGCQNLLIKVSIAGSVLAIIVAEPLGRFFHFPRTSLMLVALLCVLAAVWSGLAVAMCQGMAWFKRMAVIGVVAVMMRLGFCWVMTKPFPTAEIAVLATAFSFIANLSLLYWWKDIFRHGAERISPWNRHFANFLVVTAATVGGSFFFTAGDGLVARRYFTGDDLGAYHGAARFGRAIPATVGPLLMVMFTSRSGNKEGAAITDQRILLSLYAAGLACGALVLVVFRAVFVKFIFGAYNAEAAEMIIPFSITMTLVGLNQAIGMWSLANRWLAIAAIYGSLGLCYWVVLLTVGRTPSALLHAMPLGAGAAFCVLCGAWLVKLRRQ